MKIALSIVIAIVLGIITNWIWDVINTTKNPKKRRISKIIIVVLAILAVPVAYYYGGLPDLPDSTTVKKFDTIKFQLLNLGKSKNTPRPIFLYLYPLRFDYSDLDATKLLSQRVSDIMLSMSKSDFRFCEAYSLLYDNSQMPENFYSDIRKSTILKITGTLSGWNSSVGAGIISNICLSRKINESEWEVLATVPTVVFGDTSKITQYPRIHFDHSIDKSETYLISNSFPLRRFNTVVGENDGNCFSDDECKESSFKNAQSKIQEPEYEIVKKVIVEKEQNRFFTYVTYSFEN